MKRISGLKLVLLSMLAVFVVSGGGLATVAAWQDSLTIGDVTVTSGEGWKPLKFIQVDGGRDSSGGLDEDGNFWGWGGEECGKAFAGSYSSKIRGVPVGFRVTQIGVEESNTVLLDNTGQAWMCGSSRYGSLGDGKEVSNRSYGRGLLVKVVGGHKFIKVAAGGERTFAIDENHKLWGWGSTYGGRLGTTCPDQPNSGNGGGCSTPVQIPIKNRAGIEANIEKIFTAPDRAFALDKDGNLYGWGWNLSKAITGTTDRDIYQPLLLDDTGKYVEIATGQEHTVAIDKQGNLWGWGYNRGGQLGLGDPNKTGIYTYTQPTRINDGRTYTHVTAGRDYTLAISRDGNTYAFGNNRSGQLGVGDKTNRYTPTLVSGGHKFTQLAAGEYNSLAIDTTGQVWTWGAGNAIGIGDRGQSSVPVKPLIKKTNPRHRQEHANKKSKQPVRGAPPPAARPTHNKNRGWAGLRIN